MMHRVQAGGVFFSRRQRKQIERLSCREPASVGWCVTRWLHRSLAQAAVEQDYVDSIHHTTVGDILRKADLHPHLWRWWRTTIWDDEAVGRALKILWCYERIELASNESSCRFRRSVLPPNR
jgi:hypothetical protein